MPQGSSSSPHRDRLKSRYHCLDNEVGGTLDMDAENVIFEVNGDLRVHFNLGQGCRWRVPFPKNL
jgi:hypothetical protein